MSSIFYSSYIEIMTLEGLKYIKDLKEGDLVLTHLKRYKKIRLLKRKLISVKESGGLFDVYFYFEGNRPQKEYELDGVHRISGNSILYTNKGWKKVLDLKPGDLLLLQKDIKAKVCKLLEIPVENQDRWGYSLDIEKDHSYFADNVLIKD